MVPILNMENISKGFPGVKALDRVSFSLKKGEVHCLIGANGAGKSTLMKILSGVYGKDDGDIFMENEKVLITSPIDSQLLGISTIYQELSLVDDLSVAENIFLGSYLKKANGFINWKKLNNKAKELLDVLDVKISPNKIVRNLSMGNKQMVEIAKSLAMDTKILIMDEPSTALSMEETEKLFKVIRGLQLKGITMIYISHKLDELYEIGDRITVLRNGRWVMTDDVKNISHEELIKHITGRSIVKKESKERVEKKETYLKVNNFTNEKLKNVSFELGKGEILGLYGLEGAGRTELLRSLFGADPLEKGYIVLDQKECQIKTPQQAVNLGIGLVPENRKTEGIIQHLTVQENALLPSINNFANYSFVNGVKVKKAVNDGIKKLNIKTRDGNSIIKNLSGGNQQKVIILKWLIHESNILLFDEPTQGIDIGAKDEIYNLIEELAKEKGTSVIVASSEIEELLTVCDRVLVMFDGEIIKEFTSPSKFKSEILHTAVSGQ